MINRKQAGATLMTLIPWSRQSQSLKLIRTEKSHVQIPIFDYSVPEISRIVKKGKLFMIYYYYTVYLLEISSWFNFIKITTMVKKYFMFFSLFFFRLLKELNF